MGRNTKNTIKRKKSFKEKRTGKIMPYLSDMTEKLTEDLSEALQQIQVANYRNVQDYVKARREVYSQFDATRKEMMEAVENMYRSSKKVWF